MHGKRIANRHFANDLTWQVPYERTDGLTHVPPTPESFLAFLNAREISDAACHC